VAYGFEVPALILPDFVGIGLGDDDVHAQGVGDTGAQQTRDGEHDHDT